MRWRPWLHPPCRKKLPADLMCGQMKDFSSAGSTHPGEEEIIIDVYKKILNHYPEFKLIIVPRHIERTGAILELLRESGLPDTITLTDMNKGKMRRKVSELLLLMLSVSYSRFIPWRLLFIAAEALSPKADRIS